MSIPLNVWLHCSIRKLQSTKVRTAKSLMMPIDFISNFIFNYFNMRRHCLISGRKVLLSMCVLTNNPTIRPLLVSVVCISPTVCGDPLKSSSAMYRRSRRACSTSVSTYMSVGSGILNFLCTEMVARPTAARV